MTELSTDLRSDFEDALRLTELERDDGTHLAAELPERWTALIGIHGGFLAALATRAAERCAPGWSPRTITTTFLRPAVAGPAEVGVDELRVGRSLRTVVTDIRQGDRAIASTRITMVAGEPTGPAWQPTVRLDLPAPEKCEPIVDRSPSAHFRRAEGTLDPSSLPFTDGPHAMVRGYVRPNEADQPIDATWLAMASDWFPPPAFVRIAPPAGGISIDLTTHVHRTLPRLADDWLVGQFEITTSDGGMATEHGRIATLDGVLLAESFQTRWMVSR